MPDHQPTSAAQKSVMEEPSSQAVARVYAEAFLDAVGNSNDSLEELGSFVEDVLEKIPDFKKVLMSGAIGRDEKIALIDKAVAPRASQKITSFLRVLARHDRLDLLPLILRESRLRYEIRNGQRRIQVTTALPLDSQAENQLRERLAAALPFSPILESSVDRSLIGGIVIRVGDTVYDSSLATRLKQLRERLKQRSLHEIQSGRDRFGNPTGD